MTASNLAATHCQRWPVCRPWLTVLENSRAWLVMMVNRLKRGMRMTRARIRQVRAEARARHPQSSLPGPDTGARKNP